jgi:uncharacterized protein YlxW (UPF0749 family)
LAVSGIAGLTGGLIPSPPRSITGELVESVAADQPGLRLQQDLRTLLRPSRIRGTIGATAIGIMAGVLFVAQWQSGVVVPASVASRPVLTRSTIDRLEAEQVSLKQQITDLRAQSTFAQNSSARGHDDTLGSDRDLIQQRAIAGTLPLKGIGIDILLDDSTRQPVLPSVPVDNYIVHEYQIRDIVNLLWGAGAIGISVNGERFVNSTSVYCVGSTILINDTRTSSPYHILAVGDPDVLQARLDDGNTLQDIKGRVNSLGLVFHVVRKGPTSLPAFDGSIVMGHTMSRP